MEGPVEMNRSALTGPQFCLHQVRHLNGEGVELVNFLPT